MTAKTLQVPHISGLDKAVSIGELSQYLQEGGHGKIDTVNWPESFPYKPDVSFSIGWCEAGIGILYNVKGLDLRAAAMDDNGPVWEDSCCEFFLADPTDGTYYNIEENCIGTLLIAKRTGRSDARHFPQETLDKVKRFSSLPRKAVEIAGKEMEWSLGLFLPFEVIGIAPDNIPSTFKANFYKCGDKTAHVHFLSWSPIGTEKPDFHRPEFFGTIELTRP